MSEDDELRAVQLVRLAKTKFAVTNSRGGVISIGEGIDSQFTPVELLLAAIAGCSAIDVDYITSKRAEPISFELTSEGTKVRDENGNHMTNIKVAFDLHFPEGDAGDKARESIPRSIAQSHDRLCTVSRTVQLGTPVEMLMADQTTS